MALLVPKSVAAAAGRRGHQGRRRRLGGVGGRCSTYTKGRRWTPATEVWPISIRLRHRERTLTDDEANQVMDAIEKALWEKLGVRRRA